MTINSFLYISVLLLSFSLHVSSCELSLAHATSSWKDENNKEFSLGDLEGKKIVVAMAYTSCQGTCPMIVSKLKKVEAKFKEQNIPVEVVIVSFDPQFDTPTVLTVNYREKMGIKNSNWHFITGTDSETRKISMLLGVKYSRNSGSGMIIHENKIILLDEHGAIEKKLESLDEDEKNLLN
jgi:protein SCO1/2